MTILTLQTNFNPLKKVSNRDTWLRHPSVLILEWFGFANHHSLIIIAAVRKAYGDKITRTIR